jgi:DNA ligase (NAD+)
MKATDFLNQLKSLTIEELQEVKGLGPVLAQNLVDFVNSDRFAKLFTDFQHLEEEGSGLDITEVSGGVLAQTSLSGKKIVITGTFDRSRDEIKLELEQLGVKVVSQVSSNTDILLAGAKAGSKLQKAEELGVRVVRDLDSLLAV